MMNKLFGYFKLFSPLFEIHQRVRVDIGRIERLLNVDDLLFVHVHFVHQPLIFFLEVIDELKVGFRRGYVRLDLAVRFVYDGQEHVQENEKDEEHIAYEVDWPYDTTGCFESGKVEIAKDDTK